ncbi:hypothetical protein CAMGR0001_0267 [Campylobacter gracilis RM3268]|uniref:Uncharacterized protein n=1 Tax=Campylobacter gracilis RM3268 TaxID=553220 RepID=C8PKP5_9BACT|nr:hypothetical protein CAMGR0001_0267 [Campylobacter gracilis RM3268]
MNSDFIKFYGSANCPLHTKSADKKRRFYIFKFELQDG